MSLPHAIHITRIVTPTDFSESSEKAVNYAATLAEKFGAKVTLIYVDDLNYSEIGMFGIVDADRLRVETKARASDKLEQLSATMLPESVRGETLVRDGKPGEEVVATAQELQADLIIVSTHGHTGLSHMLLGSTAEFIVRRATCPVLTVHDQERDFVQP